MPTDEAGPKCTIEGCNGEQSNGSSLCPKHYQEWLAIRVGKLTSVGEPGFGMKNVKANEQSWEMAPHYARGQDEEGKQHWDRMWEKYREAWFVGNITKYVERYRDKNGIADLKKAQHYLAKLIELETAELKIEEMKDATQ